ncbi:MAG: A24 family peptidase [Oscillospiraceae bacterium]|jgi:prepilin signal peptidase PulO-like enzyme (type II secretory pathway)|nr:A24 family peptidase [Oscillospiraceae bacterium]
MSYLISGLFLLFTGVICVISFVFIDYLRKSDLTPAQTESASGSSDDGNKPGSGSDGDKLSLSLFKNTYLKPAQVKKSLTQRRIIYLLIAMLLNCYTYYRVFTFDLHTVAVLKIFFVLAFLMSAMFIDKATKKIPNLLILTMLGTEALFIPLEFFFEREEFKSLIISSVIGFFGSFVAMFLLSLMTRGGMGMGDVKLFAAIGLLMGAAASFYTFVYAMLLCFFAALFMLFFAHKNMKDKLSFGPFIYFGFLSATIFGTF